jgi:hypothetical protein
MRMDSTVSPTGTVLYVGDVHTHKPNPTEAIKTRNNHTEKENEV